MWACRRQPSPVKKGGPYEPSISELTISKRTESSRDRACVAGTATRVWPDHRAERGADSELDCAANGGRPAGPAGGVGLSHHHAVGAAARAWNERVLYRRGSREFRESRKPPPESRSRR